MEQPDYFNDGTGRVCELLKGYTDLNKPLDCGTKPCTMYRRVGEVLPLQIDAYRDADHANCPDTSRSVTGYLLRLNKCVFMYKSKKQDKVTIDTCSSELFAASMCVEDLMWARKLLKEIRGKSPPCSTLHMDNQSTITVVKEHGNYKRMKRFAKKSRKIAEFVKKGKITVEYDSSGENILLTLPRKRWDLSGSRVSVGH
ncbi:unnamed protein product [Phytophthora fragariaefolia]|uniref:Unnamed protein product n=1 Tax=Phytophthora fragariaefolia TaxID=1490495 RepID=A0A9W6YP07_9STRA|nr:unnamed protein product [Phytophthora fragariaefolia]